MIFKNILKEDFIYRIDSTKDFIAEDSYIIRVSGNKIQIGTAASYFEEDSLILKNVINIKNNEYFAEEGILKLSGEDKIYIIDSFYNGDTDSKKALHIITNWALYVKNTSLQKKIITFVKETFAPKFVLYLKDQGELNRIFIPIQQKFQIGKFSPNINWEESNLIDFKNNLETLLANDYVTYMGHIPKHGFEKPMFFSTGKISHLETDMRLKDKPYLYNTNCGGNIKFLEEKDNRKFFLVDAGASYKGPGVNATEEDALEVINNLKKLYPEFCFIPTSGRNAIGTQYSF